MTRLIRMNDVGKLLFGYHEAGWTGGTAVGVSGSFRNPPPAWIVRAADEAAAFMQDRGAPEV